MLARRGLAEPVLALMNHTVLWLFLCKVSVGIKESIVLRAFLIDGQVTHVLATKGTNHIEFLKLFSILVDKPRPLFHLIPRFLIKFILVVIVFLLKLARQFPDHVIFEFEKAALFFIMVDQ